MKKETNNILYPAKKRVLSCTRSASSFPKINTGDTWEYEREFDRLNGLINVREG